MALPKHLEEQEQVADEQIKALSEPAAESGTPVDPVVKEDVEESFKDEEPAKAQGGKAAKRKIDETDYKERFSRYKESTDLTIAALRRENAEHATQKQQAERERTVLLERMEQLEQQVREHQPIPDILSEDERERIGDEAYPVIAKLAKAMASKETDYLRRELAELKEHQRQSDRHQEQTAEQSRVQQFMDRAKQAYPDMVAIDDDPGFHDWLNRIDELSGVTRRNMAHKALSTGDVGRFVSFYREYADESAAKHGPELDPREGKIVPGRSTDPQPAAVEKRIWTSSRITEFYDNQRKGKYSREQFQALEADLFAAQREGRIRKN